ncbi:hypothetical protein M422DRAFT_39179 [Sphaerobolus stellatus SS14]|uniref:Uncharacterized protein n=1 Tax=Sphaerobolus stellatus (strain SS14) TaxID=990650 RepID=A0A0C9T693_SPHS4|nr:hypothetical protein M422DRAFT_39179 [Sphaerobolus stellatus SS14]
MAPSRASVQSNKHRREDVTCTSHSNDTFYQRGTESEFGGMSCEREVRMRRRIPKLARLQKDVFKCSIPYLIASLFTFVPCCLRMCPLCVMATAD